MPGVSTLFPGRNAQDREDLITKSYVNYAGRGRARILAKERDREREHDRGYSLGW